MSRVVVIGAGLAGLVAAIRAARAGRDVVLVGAGLGGLPLSPGTIDVVGYLPAFAGAPGARVEQPLEAVAAIADAWPDHPYARIGADAVRRGVEFLAGVVGEEHLVGTPERNHLLPTAAGAMRPACLVPPGMAAGECVAGARFLIAGLTRLKDFSAGLIAGNLARTPLLGGGHLAARPVVVDVPVRDDVADTSTLLYARALDAPAFRERFAAALRPLVTPGESVGLPAVLGWRDRTAWRDLADRLGHPVFEIPLPPPSIPGLRLHDALTGAAQEAGVRFILGARVGATAPTGGRLAAIEIASAGSPTRLEADAFILATGGFESGALSLDADGFLREAVFDLPLMGVPEDPDALVHGDVWGDQPLFGVGVRTDESMRPLDADGHVVAENLYAVGGILGGAQRTSELSGEGIAVGSAIKAVDAVLEEGR